MEVPGARVSPTEDGTLGTTRNRGPRGYVPTREGGRAGGVEG
jgi:hypothetical protein